MDALGDYGNSDSSDRDDCCTSSSKEEADAVSNKKRKRQVDIANAAGGSSSSGATSSTTSSSALLLLPPSILSGADDDDAAATTTTAASSMIHWSTDYLALKRKQQHGAAAGSLKRVVSSMALNYSRKQIQDGKGRICYADILKDQHDFYAHQYSSSINESEIVTRGVSLEEWESIDQIALKEEEARVQQQQQQQR